MKNRKILIIISITIILIGIVIFVWQKSLDKKDLVSCTEEAKICSDGSAVGRTGPNCEFSECPENNLNNIEIQYPRELTTQYISAQDWPPTVKIKTGTYFCIETPKELSSVNEITSQIIISGKTYCLNIKNEGAAGSIYSSYSYITFLNEKLIEISFTLRYVNCDNYNQEQNQACVNERETFNPDNIVSDIIENIKL